MPSLLRSRESFSLPPISGLVPGFTSAAKRLDLKHERTRLATCSHAGAVLIPRPLWSARAHTLTPFLMPANMMGLSEYWEAWKPCGHYSARAFVRDIPLNCLYSPPKSQRVLALDAWEAACCPERYRRMRLPSLRIVMAHPSSKFASPLDSPANSPQ